MKEYMPLIEQKLTEGGSVLFTAPGTSMLPLLHNSDVELTAVTGALKKLDIALYHRRSGQFVLHRVIRVNADGSYAMCGDNQTAVESPIQHNQIIAKLLCYAHNGNMIPVHDPTYLRYARRRARSRPFRAAYTLLRRGLYKTYRLIREIFHKKQTKN